MLCAYWHLDFVSKFLWGYLGFTTRTNKELATTCLVYSCNEVDKRPLEAC